MQLDRKAPVKAHAQEVIDASREDVWAVDGLAARTMKLVLQGYADHAARGWARGVRWVVDNG